MNSDSSSSSSTSSTSSLSPIPTPLVLPSGDAEIAPKPTISSMTTRDPDAPFSGGGISCRDGGLGGVSCGGGGVISIFAKTDTNYLNEEKGQQKDAGSTASTALLVGDRLLVANVGDSRVVACRGGSAVPLSIDHKPDRSDERQRIEDAGGFVIWAGTWRVGGVLAVSRAFGDKLLKQFVTAEPEIEEQEIDGVDFIIIASDGLWNEAVSLVLDIKDAEAASRRLTEEAFSRGSSDNITCLVVRFENEHHNEDPQ
ncbi:putative protein phosphatase 2C 11 [Bienertia sinuspersici]